MLLKEMYATTVNKNDRIELRYEFKLSSFLSFDSLKIRSERKIKNKKIRREIFTFFNKFDNLGANGVEVLWWKNLRAYRQDPKPTPSRGSSLQP
jgi:hypothetical protein